MTSRPMIALFAATFLTAPLAAESVSVAVPAQSSPDRMSADASAGLSVFAPASERREHRIDYAHWDEALGWMVVPMGPSMRQNAPPITPFTGTRRIYGHDSRYRLEGNRVAFSYLTPEIIAAVSDYRADLERVGSEVGITNLPRNEQLAFWINLHNVAMIEAVAARYPLTELDGDTALDDVKLVTIAGVALSPRDIRERIVYPNWRDPKVIYGFWRGVIGGPSIQRLAYTGENVDALLALSAEEFVNSLRGIERWGGKLRVSPIYGEARQFYFADDEALRTHLMQYGREDVRELVSETGEVRFKRLESDIADLIRGERQMAYLFLSSRDCKYDSCSGSVEPLNTSQLYTDRIDPSITRLMRERAEKLARARRAGIRTGMVIYGDGEYAQGEAPEVE